MLQTKLQLTASQARLCLLEHCHPDLGRPILPPAGRPGFTTVWRLIGLRGLHRHSDMHLHLFLKSSPWKLNHNLLRAGSAGVNTVFEAFWSRARASVPVSADQRAYTLWHLDTTEACWMRHAESPLAALAALPGHLCQALEGDAVAPFGMSMVWLKGSVKVGRHVGGPLGMRSVSRTSARAQGEGAWRGGIARPASGPRQLMSITTASSYCSAPMARPRVLLWVLSSSAVNLLLRITCQPVNMLGRNHSRDLQRT